MENFIRRRNLFTPEYYRKTLTDYLIGERPEPTAVDRRTWREKLNPFSTDRSEEDPAYREGIGRQ